MAKPLSEQADSLLPEISTSYMSQLYSPVMSYCLYFCTDKLFTILTNWFYELIFIINRYACNVNYWISLLILFIIDLYESIANWEHLLIGQCIVVINVRLAQTWCIQNCPKAYYRHPFDFTLIIYYILLHVNLWNKQNILWQEW